MFDVHVSYERKKPWYRFGRLKILTTLQRETAGFGDVARRGVEELARPGSTNLCGCVLKMFSASRSEVDRSCMAGQCEQNLTSFGVPHPSCAVAAIGEDAVLSLIPRGPLDLVGMAGERISYLIIMRILSCS
jgi:hypothetical protein